MRHHLHPVPLIGAFALVGLAIALAADGHGSGWAVAGGVIGPDLSFLAAVGSAPTAPGLMPKRAVRPYNTVHHPVGPMALLIVGLLADAPTIIVLALAWASHLLWDRGVGYGRRSPEGAIIAPGQKTSKLVEPSRLKVTAARSPIR